MSSPQESRTSSCREASSYDRSVRRVLITGMSGTGKSSVIRELAIRGFKAVDTDWDPHWERVNGESTWTWREEEIQALLDREDAEVLFVSACVPNQGRFYDQFDHVVLLVASEQLTLERLTARTSNPYGKKPQELAEVLRYKETVEPLLRKGATVEIDTSIPLADVVTQIVEVISRTP
jgi:dephospho-CoA kinase